MKTRAVWIKWIVLSLILAIALSGCCKYCKKCVGSCCLPDLAVTSAQWDASARTVSVTIKNIGSSDAGQFLVYLEINQLNAPNSAKPESQYSESVAGLSVGAETTFANIPITSFSARPSIDLDSLQHGELMVNADAKGMVTECNEENNVEIQQF